MKTNAVILTAYGEPENFVEGEIDLPPVGENEVRVSVKATSFNPADKWLRSGAMFDYYPMPCPIVLGWDFAGIVQEVGANVRDFAVGDEVFGRLNAQPYGSYAAELVVAQHYLARKPQGVDFSQAAALALIGTTAYQALFDHAKLQAGETVLVHGGAGGVGNMAVQLAHLAGAKVIATASGADLPKLYQAGAESAIDYRLQDFRQIAPLVDVVIDTVGGQTLADSLAVLAHGGRLISVAEVLSDDLIAEAKQKGVQAEFIVAQNNPTQLEALAEQVAGGKLNVPIAHILPLNRENVIAAHTTLKGKTVFLP